MTATGNLPKASEQDNLPLFTFENPFDLSKIRKTVHVYDGQGRPLTRPMTTDEASERGIALFE